MGLARSSGTFAVVTKAVSTTRGICGAYRRVLIRTLLGPARSTCPPVGCTYALVAVGAGQLTGVAAGVSYPGMRALPSPVPTAPEPLGRTPLGPALLGPALLGRTLLGRILLGAALLGPALLGPALLGRTLLGRILLGAALLGPALLGPALLGRTLLGRT